MTTETPEAPATRGTDVPVQRPEPAPSRGPLQHYFEDVDQWFDELRRQWLQPLFPVPNWLEPSASRAAGRMPRVDVIDRDTEFLVRAELPGVTKDNLELTMQENTLLLRAVSQTEETEEKGQYFRRETSRGEFQRLIRLPGPVDVDQARANFKDGILELVLPKQPGAQRKSIPVQ